MRDELRHNAEHLAAEAGLEIEFIRRLKAFRKEERIKAIIAERVFKLAALRKNIYSLHDLQNLLHAANDRYLSFMACIDNPDAEHKAIDKMTGPAKVNGRSFRGFNLFLDPDYRLFLTLCRGEWSISGFHTWWRMLTDSDETL